MLQKQQYTTWIPGNDYPRTSGHDIQNLGLGLDVGGSALFFSLEKLFEENSPLLYKVNEYELLIHFDSLGLTAWTEDSNERMIPSVIVYDWAWINFYPNTEVFKN